MNIFLLYNLTTLLNSFNNIALMNPKGNIGLEQRTLILISLGLMLIVVIPVIIMTIIFSIKYRSSNIKHIKYNPNWSESKKIEFFIWTIPVLIIFTLSILTWKSTHKLDPKNPIKNISLENIDPIIINVIALDWKWLFIYPKYNIATINEIAFPINVPIHFNITSNSVMNSFFIPQLGSQIYAMAGMCTQLNLIAYESGIYKGISSNFSGRGFSGMKFNAIATKNIEEFNQWIHSAQLSQYSITSISDYKKISQPSEFNSVVFFFNIEPNLFLNVIKQFSHHHQNL